MRHRFLPLLLGASLALVASPAPGQDSCLRCHGDAELLLQQAGTSAAARAALVDGAGLHASAHTGMACAACHEGFGSFPHAAQTATATCRSCHEEAGDEVARSLHTDPGMLDAAGESCRACHGTHDVAPLVGAPAVAALDARCSECHSEARLGEIDVHRGEVGCHACHGGHGIQRLGGAGLSAARQEIRGRCESCHEEESVAWAGDAHGQATAAAEAAAVVAPAAGGAGPPTCTGCHQPHDMAPVEHPAFTGWSIERCSRCHPDEAASATGTYHIRARELGSEAAASCADCHGAHGIFPGEDERSWTSSARLLGTCQACHSEATASFAEYQPHPEPTNRAKNPWVFASFWFMNLLLAGVLGVFLLHTLAWWVRIGLDRRRADREGGTP